MMNRHCFLPCPDEATAHLIRPSGQPKALMLNQIFTVLLKKYIKLSALSIISSTEAGGVMNVTAPMLNVAGHLYSSFVSFQGEQFKAG